MTRIRYAKYVIALLAMVLIIVPADNAAAQISVDPAQRISSPSGLEFITSREPTRIDARVGAYYYWRVIFADSESDEYYARNSGTHRFVLKSPPPESLTLNMYRAVLQRRLYSWEPWEDFQSDVKRYFVDRTIPKMSDAIPTSGITVDGDIKIIWNYFDVGCGMHPRSPYRMILKNAAGELIVDTGWSSVQSYKHPTTLDLGSYTWNLLARDGDENTAYREFYFRVGTSDRPQLTNFNIFNEWGEYSGYTNSSKVSVQFGGYDKYKITAYHLSKSRAYPSPDSPNWIAISPQDSVSAAVPYDIGTKDGAKDVYLCLKNSANIISDVVERSITLDTVPPVKGDLLVNNGAQYTAKREVKVQIYAEDVSSGIGGCMLRETAPGQKTPGPVDLGWVNYNFIGGTREVDFILTDGEGIKTLIAWYRDRAGNVVASPARSIHFTQNPPIDPVTGKVSLRSGTLFATNRIVALDVSAVGSVTTRVAGYYISDAGKGIELPKPSSNDPKWKMFPPVPSFAAVDTYEVSQSQGTREINVWFIDAVGNVSTPAKCDVTIDALSPVCSVSINKGAEWTTSQVVALEYTASDTSGIDGYYASLFPDAPGPLDPRWMTRPLSKNISETVNFSVGSENEEKKIYFWVRDGAGNISRPSVSQIKLDTEPPVAGTEETWVTTIAGAYEGDRAGMYRDGVGTEARFATPSSIAVLPEGDLIVVDADNNRLRRITIPGYTVSTFAGTGREPFNYLSLKGPRLQAPIGHCNKVIRDSFGGILSNTYHEIFCIFDGNVSPTFGSNPRWDSSQVKGHALGEIYVENLTSLTADRHADIFFSDMERGCIWKIDRKNQYAFVFAGVPFLPISSRKIVNGPRNSAVFGSVSDLHADGSGNVFVCDTSNSVVRKIRARGDVVTYVGWDGQYIKSDTSSTAYPLKDGFGTEAIFCALHGITVDTRGNVFVTEVGSCSVRKITPNGYVRKYCGRGERVRFDESDRDGPDGVATFDSLQGIAIDNSGVVYVADAPRHKIKMITCNQSKRVLSRKDPRSGSDIVVGLVTSDNFSGVGSYYVSESFDPPSPSAGGWNSFPVRSGQFLQTAEISFALADPVKASNVYVWYKDVAGNVSLAASAEVNVKNMRVVTSIGDSARLSAPRSVACSRDGVLLVADSSDIPVCRIDARTDPRGEFTRLSTTQPSPWKYVSPVTGVGVFRDGHYCALEPEAGRITVHDQSGTMISYISSILDLYDNYTGSGSEPSLRKLITDKYTLYAKYRMCDAGAVANQEAGAPADVNFVPSTIEIFLGDNAADKLEKNIISIHSEKPVTVSVTGSGSSPLNINSAILRVSSADDPDGFSVSLIETGPATDVFRGTFRVGKYTDRPNGRIGVSAKKTIFLSVSGRHGKVRRVLTADGSWKEVGGKGDGSDGQARDVSMTMHGGAIYLAYTNLDTHRPGVRKFSGGKWSQVGAPALSDVECKGTSIFVYNDIPYVAFSEKFSGDPRTGERLSVKRFVGSAWEYVGGPGFSNGTPIYFSLFVDNGTPYTAYCDYSDESRVYVKRYDQASGRWSDVGPTRFSDTHISYLSLFVQGGVPYVAYKNHSRMDFYETTKPFKATPMVKRFANNAWEPLGVTPGRPVVKNSTVEDVAFCISEGVPYVAIIDKPSTGVALGDFSQGVAQLFKYEGNTWTQVGSGSIASAFHYLTLDIGSGIPYMAFATGGDVLETKDAMAYSFENGEWQMVGQEYISTGGTVFPVIKIYDGVPYVAYSDTASGGRITVKKFER